MILFTSLSYFYHQFHNIFITLRQPQIKSNLPHPSPPPPSDLLVRLLPGSVYSRGFIGSNACLCARPLSLSAPLVLKSFPEGLVSVVWVWVFHSPISSHPWTGALILL